MPTYLWSNGQLNLAESPNFGVRIFNDSAIIPTDVTFPILSQLNFGMGKDFLSHFWCSCFFTAQD